MTDQTTKNQQVSQSPEKNDDQINFVVKRKLEGQELKDAIRKQIEYYFSRENLSQDAYLVSQMDNDLLVPLSVVANFKMVKMLTDDIQLIVDALKDSKNVILNEKKDKIGPNFKLKKNVIILRDIPKTTDKEVVKNLFLPVVTPIELRPDVGDTWFITFETDEDAQIALEHIRKQTFNNAPVKARLKTESLLKSINTPNHYYFNRMGHIPYTQIPPFQPQQWEQQQTQIQQPQYQQYDTNWSGKGKRGGYRGNNRNQRRYQKRGQQNINQQDQSTGQQKETKGSKKNKENKRGNKKQQQQREKQKKQQQPVPNYGLKNFPPLPMGGPEFDLDKPGYPGEFIKYSKQTVVEVVKNTMLNNLQRPESLPKDCAAVLQTPNTELELTKPLPPHLASTVSTTSEIKAPQPIKPAAIPTTTTPETPTKSFVEAAITARDIKTPDVIVRQRKLSQKRNQPVEKKKEGKKNEKRNDKSDLKQENISDGNKSSKPFQNKKKNKRRKPRKFEKKVENKISQQNEKKIEQTDTKQTENNQVENKSTYASVLTQNSNESQSSEQNGKKNKSPETKTTGTK